MAIGFCNVLHIVYRTARGYDMFRGRNDDQDGEFYTPFKGV